MKTITTYLLITIALCCSFNANAQLIINPVSPNNTYVYTYNTWDINSHTHYIVTYSKYIKITIRNLTKYPESSPDKPVSELTADGKIFDLDNSSSFKLKKDEVRILNFYTNESNPSPYTFIVTIELNAPERNAPDSTISVTFEDPNPTVNPKKNKYGNIYLEKQVITYGDLLNGYHM